MNNKSIKAAIIEDHELFRKGFCSLMKKEKHIEIITETNNSKALFKALSTKRHDIVFVDIILKEENGIELTNLILSKFPDIKVIALSGLDDGHSVKKMMEAGAAGYFTKNINMPELRAGIKKIMSGVTYISNDAAQNYSIYSLFNHQKQLSGDLPKSIKMLTHREKEITDMVLSGMNNREISQQLHISPRTVETHRNNILQKVGAKNTIELIQIFQRIQK